MFILTGLLFAIFAAVMIGIGIWGMKHTVSVDDFFLGGRRIGPWVSALSYGTAYFSAVVFIGFAGKLGWLFGLDVLWIAAGNVVAGAFLAWLVLGKRTRRMSQQLNARTMPEFFAARFGSQSMKYASAAIIFVFLLPYSASVFKGLGHLFEVTFGIGYVEALAGMTLLTGIYLVLGGYKASSRTDFIQGIIMMLGCVAVMTVFLGKAQFSPGGLVEAIREAYAEHSQTIPLEGADRALILWSLVFMTSFGTWGLPQLIQKYYAIRDESVIFRGAVVTTVFSIIVVGSAYFIGARTHLFFDNVSPADFDKLVPTMLQGELPNALMALMLLLILSASMSTLASLVLVSTSAAVVDLWRISERTDDPKKQVMAMRVVTGVFTLASFVLAIVAQRGMQMIVDLMSLSWGTIAGTFMAVYLYGLFWKGCTKTGAIAGMITGFGASITGFFLYGTSYFPVSATAAMLAPFVVIPVVSLLTKPVPENVLDNAFGSPETAALEEQV